MRFLVLLLPDVSTTTWLCENRVAAGFLFRQLDGRYWKEKRVERFLPLTGTVACLRTGEATNSRLSQEYYKHLTGP